jgi:hypothetical protein
MNKPLILPATNEWAQPDRTVKPPFHTSQRFRQAIQKIR